MGSVAMLNLGIMYANGRGVAKDDNAAVRWYRRAAEAGEPTAMYNMGRRYAAGEGVAQDNVEAVKWLHKAADAGNVQSMGALGGMYAEGMGVENVRRRLDGSQPRQVLETLLRWIRWHGCMKREDWV